MGKLAFEPRDPGPHSAAVDLELRLARPARTDGGTARLSADPGEVRPLPAQPRQLVAQLGQLDLHLALGRRRPLGEDVEDQGRAVDHAPLDQLLEVALLRR